MHVHDFQLLTASSLRVLTTWFSSRSLAHPTDVYVFQTTLSLDIPD